MILLTIICQSLNITNLIQWKFMQESGSAENELLSGITRQDNDAGKTKKKKISGSCTAGKS
jgi:hypothetical protein